MNFKDYLTEQKSIQLVESVRSDVMLMESILDYFGKVVAKVKNSDGVPEGLDLTQLAVMMTALKILGSDEYKDSITKDDVGIDAGDQKQLYTLLNAVKADVKQEPAVKKVIDAVVKLAPSELKRSVEEVNKLNSEDEGQRKEVSNKLAKFYTTLQAAMNKMRGASTATTKPTI